MRSSRRDMLGLMLGLPLAGCVGSLPPPPFEAAPDRNTARKQLKRLSHDYEELMHRHGELLWRAESSRDPAAQAELPALDTQALELMARAERLLEYHEALLPPAVARAWQLGALGLRLLRDPGVRQLEDQLESAQTTPVDVGGVSFRRVEARLALLSRSPEERDDAARALMALQERCAPIARDLLLRRRARARELGENFYEAALRVRRVDLSRLEQLAQAFVRGTDGETRRMAGALRRVLRFGVGRRRGQVAVHDLDYAFQRLAPLPVEWFPAERTFPVARNVFQALGLEAPGGEFKTAKGDERFLEEVLSVPVAIPGDVRALLPDEGGMARWQAALREFGRIAQLEATPEVEPLLKGYPFVPGLADPGFDTGFAMCFSNLLGYPKLLEEHAGLRPRVAARAGESMRVRGLIELRRRVAWMTFERRALGNPKQDLNRLAGQAFARLTGINHPVFWATDPRLVRGACCEPGAFLAQLLARDVHAWLRGSSEDPRQPPALTPALGRRLLGLLSRGASGCIDEKLVELRGRRLSARPTVRALTWRAPSRDRPIML